MTADQSKSHIQQIQTVARNTARSTIITLPVLVVAALVTIAAIVAAGAVIDGSLAPAGDVLEGVLAALIYAVAGVVSLSAIGHGIILAHQNYEN